MSTEHLQLKLDQKTIEAKSALYPKEVQEPVQWSAAYCRERCNRQVSILQHNAQQVGFKTDYSYWHKIFTGKYFVPGVDGKPIGSVHNFLQIVEALRFKDRIEWRAGRMGFIETENSSLIFSFIDKKRLPQRVNKFGGIVGPTGSQKSASFIEYSARNNHGKVVHIEAPEKPRMAPFITDLARAYGESAHQNMEKKKAAITQAVNETKCIIVDNVQRLYNESAEGDQPVFNYLQKLQDDTGCTIILSYTPDFTQTLTLGRSRGYFEQFIGRMGGLKRVLTLPDYPSRQDVLTIAAAFGLKDAEKHAKYLETIAREDGRIRIYFEDLQDAKQEAGDGPLTISHLRLVRGEEEAE